MDIAKQTIAVPIWYDKERIFVKSVDIPIGTWTVVWTLTPIYPTEPDQLGQHQITCVEMMDIPLGSPLSFNANLAMPGSQQWRCTFVNSFEKNLKPLPAPQPIQYEIQVTGFPPFSRDDDDGKKKKHKKGKKREPVFEIRKFDPVIVAQPDPIYP